MKKNAVILILMFMTILAMASGIALADTLVLPAGTTIIEEEAFYGTGADIIVLPDGVTTIGDRAFGGSETLQKVYVPDSLMEREEAALEGSPNARFVYKPGFVERYGYIYYRTEDGEFLKGLQEIDGRWYLFGAEKGTVQTGWKTIDGNKYYFDPEHYYAVTGFNDIGDYTYCFDENGHAYRDGYHEIEGAEYYFDSYGIVAKGFRTIDGVKVLFDKETGQLVTGFYTDEVSHYRFYYDGKNGRLSNSIKTIEGSIYYFHSSGVMARGLTTINGKKYYFNWNTGKRITGLIDIGMGHYMFFGEDGAAKTGIIAHNGTSYYFDPENLTAASGLVTVNNNTYYFSPETHAMVTGFVRIDDARYYFASDGKLKTGRISVNGKSYMADPSGKIQTGRFTLNGTDYKADEQTGALYTGFYQTDDSLVTYYFDGANGKVTGKQQIGGYWYYFSSTGAMKYGIQTIDGTKWYFDPDTGKAGDGIVQHYGNAYLAENGIIQYGIKKRDGKTYWLTDSSGAAKTGFQRDSENSLYYFDKKTYAALTGWQVIGGSQYCFDEDGKAYMDGIHEIDGGKYCFSADGILQKGRKTINSVSYYFSQQTGKMVTGLVTLGEYTYYFTENGLAKGLKTIGGKRYYFNADKGYAQSGYVKVGSDIYFFDKYTKQGITGTIQHSDGRTYYAENGKAARNGIRKIDNTVYMFDTTYALAWRNVTAKDSNNNTYYFDENGANLYGLVTYKDKEYYFYKNGGYATAAEKATIVSQMEQAANGFSTIGGVTYYKENGKFVKGFKTISGAKYYFSPVNGAMMTGLRLINGYYYYFGSNGKMRTGSVTLSRGECWFSSAGKMLTGKNGTAYYTQTGQAIDGYAVGEDKTLVAGDGTLSGFVTIHGDKYYFRNGVPLTGMQEISGKRYYFTTDGIMRTGVVTVDGVKMYFDKSTGVQKTGFVTIGNAVYYFDETAGRLSGLQEIDGNRYYFDGYGVRLKGRVILGSDAYYFDESTGKMKYGLIKTPFGTVYANPSTGKLQTGFITTGGKKYYFRPSYYTMATGWLTVGDNQYYMNADGVQQQGFTAINGYTYYLYSDHLAKGATEINGHEYLFTDGGVMLTGWVTDGDKNYYYDHETGERIIGLVKSGQYYFGFLKDGTLGEGAVTFDDGKEYYFDERFHFACLGLHSAEDGKLHYYDLNEGMRKNKTWTQDGIKFTADANGVVHVAEVNSTFAEILNDGIQYLGTPYGNFDGGLVCSTFVAQVLNDTFMQFDYNAGKSLHMYSMFTDDYPEAVSYDKSDLQLGDLVYYVYGNCKESDNCGYVGELHHVGIYIGSGKLMEAASWFLDSAPEEETGYTLIRDLSDTDQRPIVAIIHTVQIAEMMAAGN